MLVPIAWYLRDGAINSPPLYYCCNQTQNHCFVAVVLLNHYCPVASTLLADATCLQGFSNMAGMHQPTGSKKNTAS